MNWQDSAHVGETLVKAMGHTQAYRQAPAAPVELLPDVTIAVSREAGALGTSVANELGRRMAWAVYDHGLLERIAQEMNVHVDLLENIDERHVGWLVERMEAFTAIPYVSENTYVRRAIETILSLGARGRCVIVGRGAAHVLPPSTTLRVRLIATFDDRVRTMIHEMGLTSGEASRRVKMLDRQRTAFLKDHFHIDPTDPANYDLTVNMSALPIEGCCDLIQSALAVRQGQRTKLLESVKP